MLTEAQREYAYALAVDTRCGLLDQIKQDSEGFDLPPELMLVVYQEIEKWAAEGRKRLESPPRSRRGRF